MLKVIIDIKNCPSIPQGYNKGEGVEWQVGYMETGTPSERNNRPASSGGDVLDWQVKSPKASLTGKDNCGGYIFGFVNEYYYQMSIKEFEEFVNEFGYVDIDSRTKKQKIRIKSDSKKMRQWLEERI